jgi:DNA-binding PadR family transcriptional regulator
MVKVFPAAQLGGPHFRFEPYHYGPFDKAVYQTLEALQGSGQVEIERDAPWRNYRLTPTGQSRGEAALDRLDPRVVDFARRTSDFVRGLPFAELVSAIYKAYPEMRARSVFQG